MPIDSTHCIKSSNLSNIEYETNIRSGPSNSPSSPSG